jgi:membrane-associated phospholipid phosphatase
MPAVQPDNESATSTEAQAGASSDGNALLAQRLAMLALACVGLAAAALAVDLLVAWPFVVKLGPTWMAAREYLREFFHPAETLGHGWSACFVMLILLSIDAGQRRRWLRISALVFWAGMATFLVKACVARIRPHYYFDVDAGAYYGGVWESFLGWWPLHAQGYAVQSTPSGHTATAVAMAIGLSQRWPHTRWVLVAVASMAMFQRIVNGSHFLSDCFAGAAVACFVAAVIYHPFLVGRWFEWFERRGPSRQVRLLPPALEAPRQPPRTTRAA